MIKEFLSPFLALVQMPNMANPVADPRAELLAKMHDVITPTPIGLWPPAIGWWILFLLIVSICITVAYLLVTFIQKRKYRKLALKEISFIASNANLSEQEKILRALHILKRVFFTAYPNSRATSAGIHGAQLIKLLNACAGKTIFDEQIENGIESTLYAPTSHTLDALTFLALSKRWIRQHKADHKAHLTVQLNREAAHV